MFTSTVQELKFPQNTFPPKVATTSYTLGKEKLRDNRSIAKKIWHVICTIVRECLAGIAILYRKIKSFFTTAPEYLPPNKTPSWRENSCGLILLIHGLHNHPSIWEGYIQALRSKKLEIDICAPAIPKEGDCTLEKAAKPVVAIAKNYLQKHPGKPICLLGISNGARIATYVDVQLRKYPVDILVSTIAGAHLGTKCANFIAKVPLINRLYSTSIKKELAYKSDTSRRLIDALRKPISVGSRKYDFYAATEDHVIVPYKLSLPIIDHGESHHILNGVGHLSILPATQKRQINACIRWINIPR